jgi:hypothetical protein
MLFAQNQNEFCLWSWKSRFPHNVYWRSPGIFRIKDSGAAACHVQGSITATGGGGDMTLDNIVIASAQTITISTFTLTAGNA